jgi:hypothetical protein
MSDVRAFGVTETARRALSLYFSLLPSWIIVALPVQLALALVSYAVLGASEPLSGFREHVARSLALALLTGIVWAITVVPLVEATAAAESGGAPTVRPFLPPRASAVMRVAWTTTAATAIVCIGVFVLIIPGLYAALRLSLTQPAAILRTMGRNALDESWALARGHLLAILGLYLLTGVVVVGVSLPFELIASVSGSQIVNVLSTAITSVVWAVQVVAMTLVYLRLRGPVEAVAASPPPLVVAAPRSTGAFE